MNALGQTQCQKLHEHYAASLRAYEQALQQNAECASAKEAYQRLLAEQERVGQSNASCEAERSRYTTLKREADACAVQVSAWSAASRQVQALQAEYRDLVDTLEARNANLTRQNQATLAAWQSEVDKVTQTNTALRATYASKVLAYQAALARWQAYDAEVQSKRDQIALRWKETQDRLPYLRDYDNYPRTFMGGHSFDCISQANKDRWNLECTVVKGLGNLPDSTKCHWRHMPACPTLPATVLRPDAPPPAPQYLAAPPRPTLESPTPIPTWEQWAAGKQVPQVGARPTCSPTPPTAPGCEVRPVQPAQPPNCTLLPAGMPTKPVAPTCDPGSMFAGSGAMWLLVLAAGGSLYYLAKRK